jgi:predicted O-linked N-acetylglucosamine transferase (SPINDLY family)
MGESFASRVAASLLHAIELPELVTTTLESYEKLAIDLALTPNKLSLIKEKLSAKRLTAPLFNSELFTEGLESAYIKLYERFQDNLPRDHLFI